MPFASKFFGFFFKILCSLMISLLVSQYIRSLTVFWRSSLQLRRTSSGWTRWWTAVSSRSDSKILFKRCLSLVWLSVFAQGICLVQVAQMKFRYLYALHAEKWFFSTKCLKCLRSRSLIILPLKRHLWLGVTLLRMSFLSTGTYIAILPVNDVFKLPICLHYVPDMGL